MPTSLARMFDSLYIDTTTTIMHPDTARLHIDDEFHEPVQTITDYLPQALRFSGQPKSRDITKEFTQASSGMSLLGACLI